MTDDSVAISRIATIEHLEAVQAEWRELLDAGQYDNVFLTFRWTLAWWKVFGAGRELYVLLVRSNERLIGIAPLMRTTGRRFGIARSVIQFIGTPNADYSDFIGPDTALVSWAVLRYLREHRDDWTTLELTQIPESSATIQGLNEAAKDHGYSSRTVAIEHCSSYVFEGSRDERTQFCFRRNRTFRKKVNYLGRQGIVGLRCTGDPTEVQRLLPAFFHSHIRRWEGSYTPSKFLMEINRRFYLQLVKRLPPESKIMLLQLTLNDYPLSSLFAYSCSEALHLYTVSNESYYQRKSAGIILFHMITEQFVRDGYSRVDFARGASSYKEQFVNRTSTNFEIMIAKSRVRFMLTDLRQQLKSINAIKRLIANQSFQELKRRFASALKELGGTGLFFGAIKTAWRACFSCRVGLLLAYQHPTTRIPETVDNFEYKEIDCQEIYRVASFLGYGMESERYETLKRQCDNGARCFGAKLAGSLMATVFVFFEKADLANSDGSLLLGCNEVFLTKPNVSPVVAGQFVDRHLLQHTAKFYANNDMQPLSYRLGSSPGEHAKLLEDGWSIKAKSRHLKILGIDL